MNTEYIIKLIESHYKNNEDFDQYLLKLIEELKLNQYYKTAEELLRIKAENTHFKKNSINN